MTATFFFRDLEDKDISFFLFWFSLPTDVVVQEFIYDVSPWHAVHEIQITFYACIYKIFHLLQHCLLATSVITHPFHPKNGQILCDLLIRFLKCWFLGNLYNFRLTINLFFRQAFFECLKICGLLLAKKGDGWEMSRIEFELC